MLSISVEDTGIGIPPDQLDQIFNAFEQVDSSRNRQFEGTGLGLAISTRLVALMNGRILAKSQQDCGSKFTIELLLLIKSKAPTTIKGNEVKIAGLQVLVVDDLELNRKILSERLRSWGVRPTLAASGAKALEILQLPQATFDLVIQDYQMPNMDGEELARRIRSMDRYRDLPIVVLSSVDQSLSVAAKAEIGRCEIMLKPVRSESLRNIIARSLQIYERSDSLVQVGTPEKQSECQLNILVAEDNKTNQLIVESMLKKSAVSLTFAETGFEAIRQFTERRPDIVLMDMSMPQMDGIDATLAIRKLEVDQVSNRCPIVALTANALKEDQDRCLNAGMDDFLTKPIKKEALLYAIQKWGLCAGSKRQNDPGCSVPLSRPC